jgi:zinc D-Ala-D-Ala dipeptidase
VYHNEKGEKMVKKQIVFALIFTTYFCGTNPQALVNIQRIIPTIEIDLKYATTDNFVHQKIYDFHTCYVLENVAEALKNVQADLAKIGLGLKIFDGYRTMQAQHKFWEVCPDPRYVSDPHKEMGRHTRGTAVDLTLIDLKSKQELEMPTLFDDFTEKAAPDYQGATKDAIKNRSLLQQMMNRYGFTNNRTEWWHFDYQGWQNCPPLTILPKNEDRIEL